MRSFTRGTWVRHCPTGRLGKVEVSGNVLLSVAPYPPDNGGWLTASVEEFEPVIQPTRDPATDGGSAMVVGPIRHAA